VFLFLALIVFLKTLRNLGRVQAKISSGWLAAHVPRHLYPIIVNTMVIQ
jgi:hypothetical protein